MYEGTWFERGIERFEGMLWRELTFTESLEYMLVDDGTERDDKHELLGAWTELKSERAADEREDPCTDDGTEVVCWREMLLEGVRVPGEDIRVDEEMFICWRDVQCDKLADGE